MLLHIHENICLVFILQRIAYQHIIHIVFTTQRYQKNTNIKNCYKY